MGAAAALLIIGTLWVWLLNSARAPSANGTQSVQIASTGQQKSKEEDKPKNQEPDQPKREANPVPQSAENAESKRGAKGPATSREERSTIEPATGSRKNERDLKLLQGNWRAHKVYWGANIDATAIDGGPITIDGREFVKQEFKNGKLIGVAWTITRIDATKEPKELELTGIDGATRRLVYTVDQKRFEYKVKGYYFYQYVRAE